ncbi:uncharacterized protein LOC122043811 [Zingiber officinale]|uniref:uncharacterized protein LOC122043811 n=1 Tax=Zingiber officinale TaxID=94328 RepID=UPI001C4C5480|nr:uncharacterized protein LOC122043811 [Zingiber officinale]
MASFSLTEEDVLRCCRSKSLTRRPPRAALTRRPPRAVLARRPPQATLAWRPSYAALVRRPPQAALARRPLKAAFTRSNVRLRQELLESSPKIVITIIREIVRVISYVGFFYGQVLHNIAIAEYFHWNMLRNLAGIYYEQSQLDMAILHYKQAINCDSTFIEAYNNLGNALKDVGHVEEAIKFYRGNYAEVIACYNEVLRRLLLMVLSIEGTHLRRLVELLKQFRIIYVL